MKLCLRRGARRPVLSLDSHMAADADVDLLEGVESYPSLHVVPHLNDVYFEAFNCNDVSLSDPRSSRLFTYIFIYSIHISCKIKCSPSHIVDCSVDATRSMARMALILAREKSVDGQAWVHVLRPTDDASFHRV